MKNFIIILIIIIALVLGYQIIPKNRPSDMTKYPLGKAEPNRPNAEEQLPTEKTEMAKQTIVEYTEGDFVPNTLTVPIGTIVTFTNNTEKSMWVASNPHPVHTDLSGFDQKKGVGKEDGYSFTFTQKGAWGFHNHLVPKDKGIVIVE